MKRKLFLTIAASLLVCGSLASCGGGSESSVVSSVASFDHSTVTALSISNKEALQATYRVGDADRQLTFTSTPEFNVSDMLNQGYLTIVSSDTAVASVIGSYIHSVAVGTATITATINGKSDTVDLTILESLKEPDYVYETIDKVVAEEDTAGAKVYVSSGVVASWSGTKTDGTAYGNMNLKISDTENVVVYGATASRSALTFSTTTMKYKFANPQNYLTNEDTKAIKVGDTLTFAGIRADYKSTKEISIVIVAVNGVAISNGEIDTDTFQSNDYAHTCYSYTVTGKLTAWSGKNTDGTKYGNFYLKTDKNTSDAFLVYGATITAGKLTYDSSKNKMVLSNPKDWLTDATTSAIALGDTIKIQLSRCDYNGTIEGNGIFLSKVAA